MLRSGCKINLFLDITGVRCDGHHELRTLFWPLEEPYDELHLTPGEQGSGFRLVCNAPEVDLKRNTLRSAWEAFARASGAAPDIVLELNKQVPTGAGLGGGSANAATLLLWLNAQAAAGSALTKQQLTEVAGSVGADVPFFLLNRPALGTGIGEILQSCPDAGLYAGITLLLVNPPLSVSTRVAFSAYDANLLAKTINSRPDGSVGPSAAGAVFDSDVPDSTLTKIAQPDKEIHSLSMPCEVSDCLSAHHVRNSLEPVVFAMHPELSRIKVQLLRYGAAASGMSGSGASLFGLFRDASVASKAAQALLETGVRVWMQVLRA